MILRIRKSVKLDVEKYKDIAYYIDDEMTNDETQEISFDDLCYRLATFMFDNTDSYMHLIRNLETIKSIFGKDVSKKVLKNLKTRNHDT